MTRALARPVLTVAVACCLASTPAVPEATATDPFAQRIENLLQKMTLEEKVGQLNQYSANFDVTGPPPPDGSARERYEDIRNGRVGSMLNVTGAAATRKAQELAVENSRLGIPLLFGYDVIHGFDTGFPIPLAAAASWDLEAIESSARHAATEAAAAGLHWTFAPMVDIARDARWGRIAEGAGEDPYLGARVAAARVRGFQGDDLAAVDTVAACAKHYAAYGFAEAGRDYNTVDISEQTLRNVVLPPFHAAVEAGVATLMNSFNEIGGVPATGSVHLQREILKGEWGFDGFVVSDWGSIGEMVQHGYADDLRDAAQRAITAGSDMDMESSAYVRHLVDLVESGEVDEVLVDEAVRRVLRLKFQLGLFDDPYRYSDLEREAATLKNAEMQAASRDVARKSIVLLQNRGGLLPLDPNRGPIAVIGPLAADKDAPLGTWRGRVEAGTAVSLLEGIEQAVASGVEVRHAEGAPLVVGQRSFVYEVELNDDDTSGFAEAVAAARGAAVVVMALGEDAFQTGEGRSQVDVALKGVQLQLLAAVREVNENLVVVLMNGRPIAIPSLPEAAPAIVEAWHLGSQAGHAIADVLFGKYNPSGKLPVSLPVHVGQEPLYYNHKSTGRPSPTDMVFWSHYTDAPNAPLFPFGHGLSYTTFDYSELLLSATEMEMPGEIEARVTVTNSGERAGAEVVQFYIHDRVGSFTRPVLELKRFEKIELGPGESREVTFPITAADLALFNANGEWQAEPGDFEVFVGTSSTELHRAELHLRAAPSAAR
jgi:beta-glucosidase